jgi:hypothetical protein
VQFRLTASYRDFGGLLNNVYLNRHPDFSRELSLRGAFHFDLAPGLTADLRGSYALTSGGALNWVYQPAKFAANSLLSRHQQSVRRACGRCQPGDARLVRQQSGPRPPRSL